MEKKKEEEEKIEEEVEKKIELEKPILEDENETLQSLKRGRGRPRKETPVETPPLEEKAYNTDISESACKWRDWLKLHGMTPERFLEKYTNHPCRIFVEELIKK